MNRTRLFVSLLALFALVACGGGGGGGGAPPGLDAGVNLSGPWKLTTTVTAVSGDNSAQLCDPVGTMDDSFVTIAQNAATLTVTEPGEPIKTATLVGRQAVFRFEETDADFRGATVATIDFIANGNQASGTVVTTVSRISTGAVICTETSSLTVVRQAAPPVPVDVAGPYTGTAQTTASTGPPCDPVGPATSDSWTIVQSGTTLTWDTGDDLVSGTLTGLVFNGTATKTIGGNTIMVTRQVTFTADGMSFTGTDVTNVTGGATCTETESLVGTRGVPGTPVNVAGSFAGTTQVMASQGGAPCEPIGPATPDSWAIVQNGTTVTWDTGDDLVTGTLTGLVFNGTATITQAGNTITVNRQATFAADGSSFSGIDTISVTGAATCSQTNAISGTRSTGGQPVNVAGAFAGTTQVTATQGGPPCEPIGPATPDSWAITQTGTMVTWDTGNDLVTGTLTGLVFNGTATITQAGLNITVNRQVTFAADGASFSGTDTTSVIGVAGCGQTDAIMGTRGGSTGGLNIAGSFMGTSAVIAANTIAPCEPVGGPTPDSWTITQNGSNVTWDTGNDLVTGTLTGQRFQGSGSFVQGALTINVFRDVTFTQDGSLFSGFDRISTTPPGCQQSNWITGTRNGTVNGLGLTFDLNWNPTVFDMDLRVDELNRPPGVLFTFQSPSVYGGVFSGDQTCAGTGQESATYVNAPFGQGELWRGIAFTFGLCGSTSTNYTLTATREGQPPIVKTGVANTAQTLADTIDIQ